MLNPNFSLEKLKQRAAAGTKSDVDYLMESFNEEQNFVICKMVDSTLGLVDTIEGRDRIQHYLFHGNLIQRNYACLYFKRLGQMEIVHQAFRQGAIDKEQALSR